MAAALLRLDGWQRAEGWPRIACPDCLVGSLGVEKLENLKDPSSAEYMARYNHHLEPPDELSGTFVGTLRCDNAACRRQAATAGDWFYAREFDEHDGRERYVDLHRVRYINPAPLIFVAPPRTPLSVKKAIADASAVIWISPNSAANHLRQGVEALLTAQKVKRFETVSGRRKMLTAHRRIVAFSAKRPEVAQALDAVKWIGNVGSHVSDLKVEQVLEGATYFDLALRRLYDRSDAQLLAAAKSVSKRRGRPTRA